MKISDLTNYPLRIVTDINAICPGEAICCEYTAAAGTLGKFSNVGSMEKDLIELPAMVSTTDGAFLWICVGYSPDGYLKLVADRNIQNFIAWETLNKVGFCMAAGLERTPDDLSPQIRYRLLQSEEWDAACLGQVDGTDIDLAILWNTAASPSWTINTGEAAANRILRGGETASAKTEITSTAMAGFRPVLLYNPEPKIYHRPNEETSCPLPIVTDIKQIQPGEAITCEYTAEVGKVGVFANLGTAVKPLLSDLAPEAPDGKFHFVCVGYTPMGKVKLIADRNVQGNISWETLNQAAFCTMDGGDTDLSDARIRLPHTVGARHVNEEVFGEWDVLLSRYDFGDGFTASDNALWNCASTQSWTLTTLDTVDDAGTAASPLLRIARGLQDKDHLVLRQFKYDSNKMRARIGFRPVLLYDPNPKFLHRPDEETACPLRLVNDIDKIHPGEAIACEYAAQAGKVGTFANFGTAKKPHISDLAPEEPDGTFYFICVGYTPAGDLKLIADRNLQGNISWETLNQAGYCSMSGIQALQGHSDISLRLPQTVSNRMDEDASGEWDAIVSYCDIEGKITPSDNTVWNCLETQSWTLATLSTVDEIGTSAAPSLRIARGRQDKDRLVLRQAKYYSNATIKNVGFRPVMTVRRQAYYLYRKEDDTCYKVADGNLIKTADAWTLLNPEEKRAVFFNAGQTLGDAGMLQALDRFQVLCYSEASVLGAKFRLRFTPKDYLLKPNQLFSVEKLKNAILMANLSEQSDCRVLVTTDLIVYRGYDFEARGWKMIQLQDVDAIRRYGIEAINLQNIPIGSWDALVANRIGFAFLLSVESCANVCELDQLDLTLKGWNS